MAAITQATYYRRNPWSRTLRALSMAPCLRWPALKPGGDMSLSNEIHARLRANAVDVSGDDLKPLQEAARKHGVTAVVGLYEIDSAFSGTTLFNTVAVIGPDGTILNRHRKLMPTNPERMIWGMGDATVAAHFRQRSRLMGDRHGDRAARQRHSRYLSQRDRLFTPEEWINPVMPWW